MKNAAYMCNWMMSTGKLLSFCLFYTVLYVFKCYCSWQWKRAGEQGLEGFIGTWLLDELISYKAHHKAWYVTVSQPPMGRDLCDPKSVH